MIEWGVVFTATVIADVVWTLWSKAIAKNLALAASLYAIAIIVCGSGATAMIANNYWLLIPAGAGAFVGTYVPLRFTRR